jgi:tetratricopeptide (TPR) repeat protein
MLFNRERRMFILAVLIAGLSGTLSSVSAPGAEAERMLEAAIQREIVLGDLKGAMAQYQLVISGNANRADVSRALFRYARCLEKLERRTEAHDVYTRLIRNYSDQAEAALARARLGQWEYSVSAPANLHFEHGVPGKLPDAWFVPALPSDVDHWAQLRRTGCMNGDSCAVVLVPENAPVRAGNLMQSFKATAYKGKTVRLSAWLRLEPASADDRGQMWLSVDRAGEKVGFFDDMSDRAVRETEWSFREIQAHVDRDATFIKFGVMSIGRGRVWVDRVSFAVVSEASGNQP